jgi:aminoglycoside phosphotransferase (APT) family kinase protein
LTELAPGGAEGVVVLAESDDGLVVRAGSVVFKVHAEDAREDDLAARVAAASAFDDVLLPPAAPWGRIEGRLVTTWPFGDALRPDAAEVPWADAARLLAQLHGKDPRAAEHARALPVAGGPRRLLRAIEALRHGPDSSEKAVVLGAFDALPREGLAHARADRVVHGDFHLGQLVRDGEGRLRLIDVDELGRGDPAWDLARPAAWYAAGLMPERAWRSFLEAYFESGGTACAAQDPWRALDGPARAMVVQAAARAVVKAERRPFDEVDGALLDTCRRMTSARVGEAAGESP